MAKDYKKVSKTDNFYITPGGFAKRYKNKVLLPLLETMSQSFERSKALFFFQGLALGGFLIILLKILPYIIERIPYLQSILLFDMKISSLFILGILFLFGSVVRLIDDIHIISWFFKLSWSFVIYLIVLEIFATACFYLVWSHRELIKERFGK